MRAIVAASLRQTRATITFKDGYPPMPFTEGNYALMAEFDAVNQALGMSAGRAFDPGQRGAADISFVAPSVDGIDSLGPLGSGSHRG
ncbi:MAG: hypothetical protein WEA24_12805 [Gemmatimonadota bacterium]